MSSEPIETTIVTSEPTQAVVVRQNSEIGLFGTQDPSAVIGKAEAVAAALKAVIVKQGLVSRIQGKEYARCEAWTLLGTMLGVFPVLVWTKPVEGGWEARVEARTKDGAIIGAAEAECLRSERNWQNRDDFALRSMAQTRATAKCLRMPLGFVMSLTGFEVTPAEEMVADHLHKPEPPPKPAPPKFATEKTREWFIKELGENRAYATGFLIDLGWIMPNESLESMPLRWVPISKAQLESFKQRMGTWIQDNRAEKPYDANPEAPLTDERKPSPKPKAAASSDESWRDVIISLPRKGMRRDEYLANPDTIGSLFDLRHGNDEEAQAARQRLFGLLKWEPKPREFKGKIYQPSDSDWATHKGLQQFAAWFADNHPGEEI